MRTLIVIALVVLLTPVASNGAELRVVTTLSDLASLAEEVGGDRVEVTALCKGYQDPHYLEPKPSYARTLRKADLLVYVGLELEVGWLPPLLETAHNPKLRPESPGLLEAGVVVGRLLEVPEHEIDRSEGDLHPFGNPHVLFDPRNGIAVAEAIAHRLAELDPAGTEFYVTRTTVFRERMLRRITDWEKRAAPLRGRPVAAYHKEWEYLVDWLDMELVGYVENRPGIPPSPRHVKAFTDLLRSRDVGFIMVSTFAGVDAAEKVANRGGTRAVVLPAGVGAVDDTDSYERLIDTILSRLLEAAS